MPRIRTVKPEFWSHPIMGRLDDCSQCVAIALLNLADDDGYFFADPAAVRSFVRPFDDDSTNVRRALDTLSKAGWIQVRKHPVMGAVGRVVNFTEHQKIDRPKPSEIIQYFAENADETAIDDQSTNARRTLDDQSLLEGKGREQGKEGKGKEREPASPEAPPGELLAVIDCWNETAPEFGGPRCKRDPPTSKVQSLWRTAWREPEFRESVTDLERLRSEIKLAKFAHRKAWFSVQDLLGNNGNGTNKLVYMMRGGYRGDTGKPGRAIDNSGATYQPDRQLVNDW